MLCSLCILLCSTRTAAAATDLYISEFLAENTAGSGLGMDEFGTKPDWIEIHNPGAVAVNLLGYFLTDDKLDDRKWAFPSYSLAAGARLVVYADNRNLTNPTAPNRLHTNFKLSADGEYLALTKAEASTSTMTVVSVFDPFPQQFRDFSYGVPSTGGAPTYLNSPTPGNSNSTGKTNVGPLIYNPTTTPPRPTGVSTSPPILITAEIQPSLRPVASVSIAWRVMYNTETVQPMLDNGANGDVTAGDHIYSYQIPTAAMSEGQMLRWRIIATDSSNVVSTAPTYLSTTDSDQYYGTVALTPSAQTNLPIVHTFFQDATNADNGTGARGSFFFEGQFADNVYCSVHGQSTQGFPKKSNGWNFNAENSVLFWPNAKAVKGVNLLSNYADKSKVHNTLACEFIRSSGSVGHLAFPVRVHRSSVTPAQSGFFAIADALEQGDECFLERAGRDPDGAFYKVYNPLTSASGNEKKTRKNEPFDDLQTLITNLDESIPLLTRRKYTYDNVDIPQCISYFVALALVSSQDHGHKNFYIYRDTNASGNWALFPWDVDLTWGRNWTGSYFDDTMYTNNVLSFIYNYSGNNRMYNIFHNTPEFKKMYMRRLRTVMDQLLQSSTSPNNIIETRIKQLLDQMDPPAIGTSDADLDYAKWAHWGNQNNMRTEAQRIFDLHLPGRRTFLFSQNPTINGEPIPPSQSTRPAITLEGYDSNPISGIQDQEYITLKNGTSSAADISGWSLDGGIRYTFPPGTVIPSGGGATENIGLLFVAKNIKAFRQRLISPSANQLCFVVGPYDGQMSGRGEVINLLDATGALVTSKTIAPNPSPAQLNLRITELNYAPAPPDAAELAAIPGVLASDFEFIELTNFGAATLDLSGAVISKGVDFTFPTGYLLPSNTRTLVVGNINAFRLRYGPNPIVAGQYWGNLDNTGETILLTDKVGEKVVEFTYDGTWHPFTNLGGYSLVARKPTVTPYDGYSLPTSWAVSGVKGGTPGAGDPFFSMTYQSWLHDYFTIPEQLDPALAGAFGNPDADLYLNWAEYQRGGNPRLSNAPLDAVWQSVTDGGIDYGAIGFNRRAHALDSTLVVEAAADPGMSAWVPAGTLAGTPVANTDDTEFAVFRDSMPLSDARRVLRVRDTISGAFWIARVPQSIAFEPLPDIPYPFTPLPLSAPAQSGLPVTLTVLSGPAVLTGNSLHITTPGTISISAKQLGNAGYFPATEVIRTFVVSQLDQLLDFPAMTDRPFTNDPIPLTAQISSGLPITFTLLAGPGTIQGSSLQLTNLGTFTIKASQDGTDIYRPAASVEWTFQVTKGTNVINFASVGTKQFLDPPFDLTATATSGLPVTLHLLSGPGSLNGSTLTLTGAGTIVVEALQSGDPKFDSAVTVSQSIVVNKAPTSVSWTQPADVVAGTILGPAQLNATATPAIAGDFIYTPPAGTLLQANDNLALSVQFIPQDPNYANSAASTSIRVYTPGGQAQTITFEPVGPKQYLDPPFDLTATSSAGLPVAFLVVSGPGSLQGSTLTILGAGTIAVEATQSGSQIYQSAEPVTRSITVNKAPTNITWTPPAEVPGGTILGPAQLNATASVQGEFTYTPAAGTVLHRTDNMPLSVSFIPTDSANYENGRQSASIRVLNSNPAFESPASVLPGVFIFGSPMSFTAQATDGDGDTLSYTWDFGDGSSGDGSLPSHVYAAPGVYLATVTVTDGNGGAQTSTVAVHVNRELSIFKATVKLNFQKQNFDAIATSGILQLPPGMSAGGKSVQVNIGGLIENVILDAKGKARTGKLSISIGAPKNGISKVSLTWSKSTFPLEPMGYVNSTVKNKPVRLPLTMMIDQDIFQSSSPMVYSATQAKRGAAKYGLPK